MGSSQRISSNEAPQTNALIFLVTAPHLPIHKSRQTSSSNKKVFSRYAFSLTPLPGGRARGGGKSLYGQFPTKMQKWQNAQNPKKRPHRLFL
jgi:hypothetical protein